jgi:ankyrin repeat protein
MLLDRGVHMNPRDVSGRQPIHIAVTLGITDSVRYLLTENCGISTPPSSDSLLQLALKLQDPEKSQILRLLVPVLIDRHRRLQDMASNLLPPSVYFELELAPGKMHERKAPLMVERLIAHGLDVPQALELDGKSFYNFADFFGDAKMTPEIANAFWDAGFCDIDMPDENGVTPFLQSCIAPISKW